MSKHNPVSYLLKRTRIIEENYEYLREHEPFQAAILRGLLYLGHRIDLLDPEESPIIETLGNQIYHCSMDALQYILYNKFELSNDVYCERILNLTLMNLISKPIIYKKRFMVDNELVTFIYSLIDISRVQFAIDINEPYEHIVSFTCKIASCDAFEHLIHETRKSFEARNDA